MTLAPDTAASTDAVAPRARSRNRGMRLRTCGACGKVEEVRADNPATRCRPCAARSALAQGGRARSAGRNRETCSHCGRVFPAPASSRQQFCSRACRHAAQSVERTCATCGGSFRIPRSILSDRTNSSGRFCSRSCYERHLCRTPRTVELNAMALTGRVLDCEHTLLTEEGMLGGALEIRFWPSEIHSFFVLIETPLSFVEHVIVPNPADWLPFLSRHLAPLIGVASQSSLIALHGRIGNAFIAWARHGKGTHIGRETGESRIDLDNDRDRRRAQQARAVMERERREGRT